jgi:hypothetical protein
LPEKYAYGLDRKGQGDLAYEQLDIEEGDDNELSRARNEFYEQYYLNQEQPRMMEALADAKKVINTSKTKKISDNDKIKRAEEIKHDIEVEAIPQILGKVKDPTIKMEEIGNVYNGLKTKQDRPLTQAEIYKINRLLLRLNGKRIPVGTRAYAAANRLEAAFIKENPDAGWSFNTALQYSTGVVQRNVRKHQAKKEIERAKIEQGLRNAAQQEQLKLKQAERRKRRSSGMKLDFDAASQAQQQPGRNRKQKANVSVDDFSTNTSTSFDKSPLPGKRNHYQDHWMLTLVYHLAK